MATDDMTINPDQPQIVLAVFEDRARADAAINGLRERGFSDNRLSVLVRHDDATVSPSEMAELDREADEIGTDVAVGGTIGGLAGLLGGLALTAIPGVGPFFGAGVLATTFGGAALGSAIGERWAEFHALGVPQDRSERYGAVLEAGHVLLAVTASDADEVMKVRETLALFRAGEIDVYPQGRAPEARDEERANV